MKAHHLIFVPWSAASNTAYARGIFVATSQSDRTTAAQRCAQAGSMSQADTNSFLTRGEGWGMFHGAIVGGNFHVHVVLAFTFDYVITDVDAAQWMTVYRNLIEGAWSGQHVLRHVSAIGAVTTNYPVIVHVEFAASTRKTGATTTAGVTIAASSIALQALKGTNAAEFAGGLTHHVTVSQPDTSPQGGAAFVTTNQWAIGDCRFYGGGGWNTPQTVSLRSSQLAAIVNPTALLMVAIGTAAGLPANVQITASHEFGHMIGLADEYIQLNGANYGRYLTAWLELAADAGLNVVGGDADITAGYAAGTATMSKTTSANLNIMHNGRAVRRHHYLTFYQAWRNILQAAGTTTGTFTIA